MPVSARLSLLGVLSVIGVAGLVQWPIRPLMLSRTGGATAELLVALETQEVLQHQRQEASVLLNRFVGAEITRFFWGGFSGYLDVLGIEEPDGMKARVSLEDQAVQLLLSSRGAAETYVGRVEAIDGVPRGVVCRGTGTPGAFPLRGSRLQCPQGWRSLPNLNNQAKAIAG
ncbi:hypothetical protein KQ313_08730 [Synechococcus sp. CS-1325]|uniref:hypothetical protein n=1 Tax=unclassified Synechococcus TaxID=2626047 RepID=UPI000DB1FFA4|nr:MULTISPECIES: hypothetical protein [unclassified Synechococcus]PZV01081.1 MAG: hypothetical protein DCF24_05245 [Cyanobium sp.]MCT0199760.1 hypothetical protein [Synechococcus sp. CS-1325]MCT0214220.1 hypothetical protein [Synechococcus sp. CS-1326]MCT0231311.1 hypothetical protein [Synechococcus sp. CS-1324]MCT0232550.1 hypothetical protein [Synechococcus sp. CS-1327]